jgi:hypothetical protein
LKNKHAHENNYIMTMTERIPHPAAQPEHLTPVQPEVVAPEANFHYELLRGHKRTDGSYKTDDQLRSEYVRRTDELIRTFTDGVVFEDAQTGERQLEKPDVVVYLDKSARPVAWLVKELWPKLAALPGEPVPEMPETRFVNIDREQWVNTVDPKGVGDMNIDLVDDSVVRSLRSIFVNVKDKQSGLDEALDEAPTELDGKNVLIIDEVFSSGRTLAIANKFFKRAFPKANFATEYWMSGIVQKGSAQGNADLPVWYKEKDPTGRGVDNRDERKSQRSASLTQRLGGWFLSTALNTIEVNPETHEAVRVPEPNSAQLRREIRHLAHDPNVLITPSYQRDDDEYDARATALNGLTFEQYVAEKRAIDNQTR